MIWAVVIGLAVLFVCWAVGLHYRVRTLENLLVEPSGPPRSLAGALARRERAAFLRRIK